MARLLPFRGAHCPLQAHFTPNFYPYPSELGPADTIERMNSGIVNLNYSLYSFSFMNDWQRKALAARAGYSQDQLHDCLFS